MTFYLLSQLFGGRKSTNIPSDIRDNVRLSEPIQPPPNHFNLSENNLLSWPDLPCIDENIGQSKEDSTELAGATALPYRTRDTSKHPPGAQDADKKTHSSTPETSSSKELHRSPKHLSLSSKKSQSSGKTP